MIAINKEKIDDVARVTNKEKIFTTESHRDWHRDHREVIRDL